MLAICRDKIEKMAKSSGNKINLVQADMRNFNIVDKKFSLVIIPFGPFNSLLTTNEQISCLRCIYNHLVNNGLLVFDVWYPNNNSLVKCNEGEYHVVKDRPYFRMPDNRRVQWGLIIKSVDYNKQIIYNELYFKVEYPDGRREKLNYPLATRYYYKFEMEHLLSYSGFEIKNLYSDFEKNSFGSKYPSELIIEVNKK
jgi:SAM-dependent methyltransferase